MIDLITYRIKIGIFNLKCRGPKKKSRGVVQNHNIAININWAKLLLIILAIYSTYRVDSCLQEGSYKAAHITHGYIKKGAIKLLH